MCMCALHPNVTHVTYIALLYFQYVQNYVNIFIIRADSSFDSAISGDNHYAVV